MIDETCALVDAWLHAAAESDEHHPPDAVVAHVAGCPRCRVALIALLADRIGPAAAPDDQNCSAIEAELPAFVDFERSQGLIAAARAFPDVWWHTLVCADCDEVYRALHTLAAEPAVPAVRASKPLTPLLDFEVRVGLHPGVMHQLISSVRSLGQHWGGQPDDILIAEQSGEVGVVQVSLRQEAPERLALVVRTDPPRQGIALLTLGDVHYTLSLDPDGCAVFTGLNETMLGAASKPVSLTIRPPAS